MNIGKLTNEELQKVVLSQIKHRRAEVITGAGLGEDCAAFKSNELLLISTDPITSSTPNIGALAVRVATNDIIASGGEPLIIVLTIIAPTTATSAEIATVVSDAEREASMRNAEIVGGHTEYSDAVNRIIVSTTVIGLAKVHFKTTNIAVGDTVFITKKIGIEGTAILYDKYSERLACHFTNDEIAQIKSLNNETSVANEGLLAQKCVGVSFMHDITEGGIYGAIAEIAGGAAAKIVIDKHKIPYYTATKKLAKLLQIDMYRLMSSGSLIIITSQPQALIAAFKQNNAELTEIGKVTEGTGAFVLSASETIPITTAPDQLFLTNGDIQ